MWKRQVGEQGTHWTTMEKWFDSWQGQEICLLQNVQTGSVYHSMGKGGKTVSVCI